MTFVRFALHLVNQTLQNMKTRFLFPHLFKIIGILMACPGFVLGYMVVYRDYQIHGFGYRMRDHSFLFFSAFENFTNELALTLVIVGLSFIAFSRVKGEDELSGKLRLNALYWAVLTNFLGYGSYIVLAFFNDLYSTSVLDWLLPKLSNDLQFTTINFFAPLLIFILRFNYLLYKNKGDYEFTEVKLLPERPYNIIGKVLTAVTFFMVLLGFTSQKFAPLDNFYCGLPIAMLIWMYAKELHEDEYIKALRLDAMQIAIYVNYAVLLISNFVFYGFDFLLIQMLNLITIPLIFQIRFQYLLYKLRVQNTRDGSTLSCL